MLSMSSRYAVRAFIERLQRVYSRKWQFLACLFHNTLVMSIPTADGSVTLGLLIVFHGAEEGESLERGVQCEHKWLDRISRNSGVIIVAQLASNEWHHKRLFLGLSGL